ncbi:MAG TPA: TonB-dependent receptor [Woeseiaceae bacterium]
MQIALRRTALQLCSAALLVSPGLASAQQAEEDSEQNQGPDRGIEEIVVQGTATGTGIRGVAPVGSQTIELSRVELLESPARDPAQILANLPQGSQIGSGVATPDGGNDSSSGGLNLRGLGGNASLMLLNGHRLAGQGVSEVGADPNAIPFAAIERVEVVLDGASAVYGSDAVAGVVNFIMRDDFEGLSITASRQGGAYDTSKIEMVAGHNWDSANIMFGLSYEDQSAMRRTERGYLREDLRAYGGGDYRVTGRTPTPGHAGLIEVDNILYGIPENFTGVTDPITGLSRPTLDEVLATEPEFGDSADYENYIASMKRTGAFLRGRLDVSDTLTLAFTGLVSRRESRNVTLGILPITISPDSPYYIPGLNPSGGSYSIYINTAERGFTWLSQPYATTRNFYLDVQKDIGEWQLSASAFYGRTDGLDIYRPERNNAALTDDPAGTPEGYRNYADYENNPEWFNPYLTTPQPGMSEHLIGMTFRRGDQDLTGINARIEGPVVELPAGTMRLSVGGEYTDGNHWLGLDQTVRYYDKRNYWLRDTAIDRQVTSAFAEIYAPLLADLPGAQRIALSAAVRRDDYSDFGSTTNPRLGLTWDVNDSLSFRGSYGQAFRAPTLTQVNSGVNSTLTRDVISVAPGLDIPITNPASGETDIFTRGGRTPSLGPETAEMWSIGVDYAPPQLDGLAFQFTYYDIAYTDRIEELPNWETALSSAENRAIYAPYIYTYTQPPGCVDGDLSTYSPVLTQWLALPGTRFAGGPGDCETVAVIDRGVQNVGSLDQNGIDFQTSYGWDTAVGVWDARVNVAKILDLDRTLISGGQRFSVLDRIGWQTSLRANARLGWLYENWTASLTARIEGGYTNDQTPRIDGAQLPDQEVDTWTTLDASVTYRTPEDGAWWSGLRTTLGIQNVFDKDPPIVLHEEDAIDPSVHNPFGRMVRLEVSKSWE